jgi:large subunit ribosomal protein L10
VGLKHEKNRLRAVQQIEAVRAMAESGHMASISWYRELTAQEMYALQLEARKAGVAIKVIRNRLAYRALEGTAFACLQPALKGPVLLAFSMHEPRAVARLLRDFSKTNNRLVVKHLAFEGELLPATYLDSMADLPSKEEAIVHLLSILQLPLQQMLFILAEPTKKFLRTLAAIKNT